MHLHLRFDRHNDTQTRLLLFINGHPAIPMTLPTADALSFDRLLSAGSRALDGNYQTSGEAPDVKK